MRVYIFQPKNHVLLTKGICERMMTRISKGVYYFQETLDLGYSFTALHFKGDSFFSGDIILPLSMIESIASSSNPHTIYAISNNSLFPLQLFDKNNFYKLKYLEKKAPTLEINGIHMHRIKEVDPWQDAFLKVKVLSIKSKDRVLDLCTGLGYTAIHALRFNPLKIVTVEKDVNVIKLAEYNSWSTELKNVPIIIGDLKEVLDCIKRNYFNKIIYDPPSFRIAEDLYTEETYKKLYALLKAGGIIYHYIGYIGKLTNKKIIPKIKQRCKIAGFKIIREFNYGLLLSKA